MLQIHHLGLSQSERIVWLLEELSLPYELHLHTRDAQTKLAPPELKALHPMGTAPLLVDGPITLAESAAICEYIITKYAHGRLSVGAEAPNYPEYLFWFHFANATLQPAVSLNMFFRQAGNQGLPADAPILVMVKKRLARPLDLLEGRLKTGVQYLAGNELTTADVMCVVSLTTMRLFSPFGLEERPHVVSWLKRLTEREAYKRAMARAEPGLEVCVKAEAPGDTIFDRK